MSDAVSWPFVVALGYVGLTIGALGWIVLKHVTADWRVRRRHRTIPEGDIVSIQVLEYFRSQAAKDAAVGKGVAMEGADEHLVKEAENVKALLSAFGRLHGKKN